MKYNSLLPEKIKIDRDDFYTLCELVDAFICDLSEFLDKPLPKYQEERKESIYDLIQRLYQHRKIMDTRRMIYIGMQKSKEEGNIEMYEKFRQQYTEETQKLDDFRQKHNITPA